MLFSEFLQESSEWDDTGISAQNPKSPVNESSNVEKFEKKSPSPSERDTRSGKNMTLTVDSSPQRESTKLQNNQATETSIQASTAALPNSENTILAPIVSCLKKTPSDNGSENSSEPITVYSSTGSGSIKSKTVRFNKKIANLGWTTSEEEQEQEMNASEIELKLKAFENHTDWSSEKGEQTAPTGYSLDYNYEIEGKIENPDCIYFPTSAIQLLDNNIVVCSGGTKTLCIVSPSSPREIISRYPPKWSFHTEEQAPCLTLPDTVCGYE